jgi:hypothetical protein
LAYGTVTGVVVVFGAILVATLLETNAVVALPHAVDQVDREQEAGVYDEVEGEYDSIGLVHTHSLTADQLVTVSSG